MFDSTPSIYNSYEEVYPRFLYIYRKLGHGVEVASKRHNSNERTIHIIYVERRMVVHNTYLRVRKKKERKKEK